MSNELDIEFIRWKQGDSEIPTGIAASPVRRTMDVPDRCVDNCWLDEGEHASA